MVGIYATRTADRLMLGFNYCLMIGNYCCQPTRWQGLNWQLMFSDWERFGGLHMVSTDHKQHSNPRTLVRLLLLLFLLWFFVLLSICSWAAVMTSQRVLVQQFASMLWNDKFKFMPVVFSYYTKYYRPPAANRYWKRCWFDYSPPHSRNITVDIFH